MRGSCLRGFSLVELMVVVAIIAVLIAMLLPAMENARFAARLADCSSGLRQIGVAHTAYAFDERGWYPNPATEYLYLEEDHFNEDKGSKRWVVPTGTRPDQTEMLAPYFDAASMDPRENKVLLCAQNMHDVKNEPDFKLQSYTQSYAFYANRINAQGSNQKPEWLNAEDGSWQGTVQMAVDEAKLLTRVNDKMYFEGYRNNHGWSNRNGWYDILASDYSVRASASNITARANHVSNGRGYYAKYNWIIWEEGTATNNYLFVDGRVTGYQFPVTNFRDKLQMGSKTEGGAQTIIFPKEWSEP